MQDFIQILIKFLFWTVVIGGIILAIGYMLGYGEEDVWKKVESSKSSDIVNIQKLDSFF